MTQQLKVQTLQPSPTYGNSSPMLDLTYGGQFAYTPRYDEYLNNQAHVRRNSRAVLLSPPGLFENLGGTDKMIRILRALIEVHPKSITGFDFGLTLNVASHPLGAGGQFQQEPTKMVRAESVPVFSYQSKSGRPEQRFFKNWMELILDPNTTYSSALYRTDIDNTVRTDIRNGNFYANKYAATILVFEPNQSFTYVERACIVHNFYPLTTGPMIMESNPVDDLQLEELQINFAGIVDPCNGATVLAQAILDEMNQMVLGANPCNMKPSYPGVDNTVKALDMDVGYKSQINKVKTNQNGPVLV